MSQPRDPVPVKVISSLFSPETELLDRVVNELPSFFGPLDWVSPPLFFDRTRYYEKEMGWPLHRRFISFGVLIAADQLVAVKLKTNDVERVFLREGKRRVNIDPGIISPERLVLATGKNYVHRVYLSKGIYADLTLLFKRGSFQPLEWTYRDYADPEIIGLFNEVRTRYMSQLREMNRLD